MRGKRSEVGSVRCSANGYQYTRTETGWVLTSHIIAEQKLGRPVGADERVCFVNGDKTDHHPDNIEVRKKTPVSLLAKLARLEARRDEILDKIVQLQQELRAKDS